MTLLSKVVSGKIESPPRIVIYGTEGIGKTTFAAQAPHPIMLCAEEGANRLDVAKLNVGNVADVLAALDELTTSKHEYKTIVIDSLDAMEPHVWKYVCEKHGAASIETVLGGYGKGYLEAFDVWRSILSKLDTLRKEKSIGVVLIAHAHTKVYNNPEGDNFDRYALKLNEKAAALIQQWADVVLFAHLETFTKGEEGKKSKAFSLGRRVVQTEQAPAYFAKNRHGLPATMDLDWAALANALTETADAVRKRITAFELTEEQKAYLAKIGNDLGKLIAIETKLKGASK